MADISITASNVVPTAGYAYVEGVAGEEVEAGETVYLKASDSKYWLTDADASSATAALVGMAVNHAYANQPIRVQQGGSVALGSVLTVGEIYVLSGTAGKICPEADLASGDYVTIVGVGISATTLSFGIKQSGVQVPA